MAKKIYWATLISSLIIGILIYFNKESFTSGVLLALFAIPFFMFIAGLHGIIAHSVKSETKGNIILYPVAMGIVFSIIAFGFIILMMKLFCADFPKF
jgi:hypothetical protein